MGHMMGWPLPACFLGMENAMTFAFTQFLLLLPIVYINRQYYIVGFKTLWQRSPNMDSLIALGSSAAIVYGIYAIYKIGIGFGRMDMDTVHTYMMELYFESAGTILTLITMGKTMEARAKGKTSDAITKLMDLAPKTATVERNGVESVIPVEEVQLGDVLIVSGADLMDGTPIYDIKPYLPYADAHPEALGGFAPLPKETIEVKSPPELLQKLPEGQREALLGVLAQDPRPQYQNDPERVYGMSFGGWDVKFRVKDGVLTVLSLAETEHQ